MLDLVHLFVTDESSSSDEEQMPLLNTNLQIADEINHNEVKFCVSFIWAFDLH